MTDAHGKLELELEEEFLKWRRGKLKYILQHLKMELENYGSHQSILNGRAEAKFRKGAKDHGHKFFLMSREEINRELLSEFIDVDFYKSRQLFLSDVRYRKLPLPNYLYNIISPLLPHKKDGEDQESEK